MGDAKIFTLPDIVGAEAHFFRVCVCVCVGGGGGGEGGGGMGFGGFEVVSKYWIMTSSNTY